METAPTVHVLAHRMTCKVSALEIDPDRLESGMSAIATLKLEPISPGKVKSEELAPARVQETLAGRGPVGMVGRRECLLYVHVRVAQKCTDSL